ncbi:MAG: serine/threonine protein kinase [Halobacteria archaeon]|nr:serine/threonine protein kinase [Halobacteria archaeon]
MDHNTPYADLTPDLILDAIDQAGFPTSGSLLALNSYENRVYQVGLVDGSFLVAKFYRPGRWDNATIQEEHDFALELAAEEIPVVAPLTDDAGQTLRHYQDYRFTLYPRHGGRAPELDDPEHLRWLGRMLGRIHAIGSSRLFQHRPTLGIQTFGHDAVRFLLEREFVPAELTHNYRLAADTALQLVENAFEVTGPYRRLRLHGDCHPGNILWTEAGPHFVDLDDCLNGPAVQDLWMLLSGNQHDMVRQLKLLLEGYNTFFDFDPLELYLLEALRALRLLHYSAWLARRWHDPAFPQAFPWFNTPRYWEDQLTTLREQAERLRSPPLALT